MAIGTFAELKTAVADFLNRDDLAAIVPTFVALAEADIARNLRHWRMEARVVAEIDARFSDVPSDFISPIRLYLSSATDPMELMTHAEMMDRRSYTDDAAAQPRAYAMVGGQFEFYPTPDEAYTLEMVYIARPSALSADGDTNWILTSHPDLLLYGSLIHSAPYLKDDARIAVWASMYQSAIDGLNQESEKAKNGGARLRMRIRGAGNGL